MSQPYCLMPWIHFHVSNKGSVRACCVANIPFGNINSQTFEEIWNGNAIETLREKFKTGQPDKRCAACFKLEEAGGKSIRQETLEKYASTNISHVTLPFYFDIRFSNACNFKCRTCWHGSSSGWFADAKKLGRNIGDKAVLQNIEDIEHFVTQLDKPLQQAKEIYLAGGEPLITTQHYYLLQWLIKKNHTQLLLRYNTNFSVLELGGKSAVDLWQNFKHIEILASVDASEELGEYIRKGMKWETLLANRQKIRKLSNIQFYFAPTISVYNVYHLPTLYLQAVSLQLISPENWYINILHRPFYYNIQALPYEHKQEISLHYKQFLQQNSTTIPEKVKQQFLEIVNFMLAQNLSKHWPAFIQEQKKIDLLRNETIELNPYSDNV